MHRVHLKSLAEGENILTGSDALHLSRVLRARAGTRVTAFDGAGLEAAGLVREVAPERVVLQLGAPGPSAVEAALAVTVAVALLKGDKLKDVVRQCTELGAAAFTPLSTARSESKVPSENKLERLRRVAREAAKQSGRSVIPEVAPARPLKDLLAGWRSGGQALLHADPRAGLTLAAALPADAAGEAGVLIVTGPEGGLTPQECELLLEAGSRGVRLGNRILRAETAPVALLAVLLLPEAL
jgi:16S rRNA (uracil1498-N3)-methyltransferase